VKTALDRFDRNMWIGKAENSQSFQKLHRPASAGITRQLAKGTKSCAEKYHRNYL
jgi:hypothetical protein